MTRQQVVDSKILCLTPYQFSDICPPLPTQLIHMVLIVRDNVKVFRWHYPPENYLWEPWRHCVQFFLVFCHLINDSQRQRIGENNTTVLHKISISTIQYRNVCIISKKVIHQFGFFFFFLTRYVPTNFNDLLTYIFHVLTYYYITTYSIRETLYLRDYVLLKKN